MFNYDYILQQNNCVNFCNCVTIKSYSRDWFFRYRHACLQANKPSIIEDNGQENRGTGIGIATIRYQEQHTGSIKHFVVVHKLQSQHDARLWTNTGIHISLDVVIMRNQNHFRSWDIITSSKARAAAIVPWCCCHCAMMLPHCLRWLWWHCPPVVDWIF